MNEEQKKYFAVEDCPVEEVSPGVKRAVLAHGKDLMICHLWFEKGAVGALHHHPHVQATYILSGKFEYSIGGVKKVVKAGDSLYKVSGVEHGAVCLEKGEVLDIFTPEREDFLK
ncbi:MAG: cupin domain-containing protein [Sphaerochaetaceae bacterium]|nr:cupin domain-containing protein [Spirochaetales bacterium]MDY5499721.1 cupin domain-containing protein [Sphaerochaetaceae bacterium]